MFLEHISAEVILFLILYSITGVVPLLAAVYLLLRRGNAFAPDITPPLRLRRWAASFFVAAALGHVWWYLFYVYSHDIHSVTYVIVALLDCVMLLITIAGTLLAMLQDRKRPVWPAIAAMILFVALGVLQIIYPDAPFMVIAAVYLLSFYVLFSVYIAFAVRKYGRWLNDNYADLENKKVWLSQAVSLVCLLLFILYALVDTDIILIYLLHVVELLLFSLLLWRVETLPQLEENSLTPNPSPKGEGSDYAQGRKQAEELSALLSSRRGVGGEAAGAAGAAVDFIQLEKLLDERCVATHLYLQHELTLHQLAQAIGTNRSYLGQYFSSKGISYNTYISSLRISHFISRYEEAVAAGQPVGAKRLASESGFRSYSTFGRAFKQRTGQSVTAWMRQSAE